MIRYQEQIEKSKVQRTGYDGIHMCMLIMLINSTKTHNSKWIGSNVSFKMKAHLPGYAFKC